MLDGGGDCGCGDEGGWLKLALASLFFFKKEKHQ